MRPVRDPVVRNGQRPSRPPPTAFTGFLGKMLPRNRPEQGGTARVRGDVRGDSRDDVRDDTGDDESAYTDLGIDPNELTQWNLARERSLKKRALEGTADVPHRRGRSWSFRQRTGLDGDLKDAPRPPPRLASADIIRTQTSRPAATLEPSEAKPQPLTKEEIATTLRAKEASRKSRRDLIESGDWLGVQGADPTSGEFAVLTPTSTVSSDATEPSIKKRLAKLSRKRQEARLAYERVKMEEELERERIVIGKGKAKLEKILHAKDTARQKQDLPTWSRHRRLWSSAAEPDLSPIAQSVNTVHATGSLSNTGPSEYAAGSVRNFSRPSRFYGDSTSHSERRELLEHSQEPDEQPSTETIVRRTRPRTGSPDMPRGPPEALRSRTSSLAEDMPPQRHKSEKHFLWSRRRRMTDPGKLSKKLSFMTMNSSAGKTQDDLVSASADIPPLPKPQSPKEQRDHFADLRIPDSRLHVPDLESAEETDMQSDNSQARPPLKSIFRVTTNLSESRTVSGKPRQQPWEIGTATVISSQSNSNGTRKPRHIYRSPIHIRSSSSQVGVGKWDIAHPQLSKSGQIWNEPESGFKAGPVRGNVMVNPPLTTQEPKELPPPERLDTENSIGADQTAQTPPGVSASTLTTITTGSDPNWPAIPDSAWARTLTRGGELGSLAAIEGAPATLNSRDKQLYTELVKETGRGKISSQPPIQQSDSQKWELAHKIADLGTSSTDPATPKTEATARSHKKTPPIARQSPHNSHMALAQEREEHIDFSMLTARPDGDPSCQGGEANKHANQEIQGLRAMPNVVGYTTPGLDKNKQAASEKKGRLEAKRLTANHQRRQEEADMIQEAARVAMQRSRAREIETAKGQPPSPHAPEEPAESTTPLGSRTSPGLLGAKYVSRGLNEGNRTHHSRVADDIGFPSSRLGSQRCRSPRKPEPRSWWRLTVKGDAQEHEARGESKEGRVRQGPQGNGKPEQDPELRPDAAVAVLSVLFVACLMLIRLGCGWWTVISPVFDGGSAIRRRQRQGEGTWKDLAVFLGAALFCIAGGAAVTWFMRVTFM